MMPMFRLEPHRRDTIVMLRGLPFECPAGRKRPDQEWAVQIQERRGIFGGHQWLFHSVWDFKCDAISVCKRLVREGAQANTLRILAVSRTGYNPGDAYP